MHRQTNAHNHVNMQQTPSPTFSSNHNNPL